MMKHNAKKRIFSIYANIENPDAEITVVAEKPSFWAFLFHGFWLIYHRAYISSLLWFTVFTAIAITGKMLGLDSDIIMIAQFAAQAWLGLEGHYLLGREAEFKGLQFEGVIVAANAEDAELRYYETHSRYQGMYTSPAVPYTRQTA